jgi:hypothetical protein
VLTELQQNDAVAGSIGFNAYSKDSFVNPDISGLASPTAQRALFDFGIHYEISDTSRPGQSNPSFNAGIYNSLQPRILETPRHASNLFYNLYTPNDWVQEYNCFYYQGGIQVNGTMVQCGDASFDQYRYLTSPIDYAGVIDHESNALLSYLLKWDIDPMMFHQENLVQYQNSSTLLTELLNATFQKYSALYRLPIRNLREHDTGVKMAQRTAYNNTAGLKASMVPCGTAGADAVMTLVSPTAVTVPVTGVNGGGAMEVYGGQNISYVNLAASTPVTLPLICP